MALTDTIIRSAKPAGKPAKLGAALIAGDQIVSIDNCELPLDGDLLCQVLTQQRLKVRFLGQSKLIEVPTQVSMFATGNNLVITGDLPRRSLLCALDPQCERPELRKFEANPLDIIRTDRARYVLAVLTILRAYFVAGRPCRPPALGSFEEWSDWVRGALLWLGQADPCKTMEAIRSTDPKLDAQKTIFEQWHSIIGTVRISVRRLCKVANEQHQTVQASEFKYPALREALLVVSGEGGAISTRRLGKWLGANANRVVEGKKIVRDGTLNGDQQWRLELVLAGWAAAA